ncbi:M20 metallopeptidase family protein [Jeotgalicoccus meleagridis]|uniref:Putative hydrolase YxeP n=1 Tax=Jeotgalicoccus meleagridis TaxID=2759181 RepID=A0A6V7RBM2_9STAP|nr:M20 family metallopeptidase [Jeotgalicoccus meleagridis]CAD2074162.1 putative hydrolase YxeP [Jeotgalicoccus meleagridis]
MSSNLQEEIKNFVKDIEEKLVSFRRSMHQNPELSSEEYNTSEKIFKFLEKEGLKPQFIEDRGIGVTALIEGKTNNQTVAYRADIDALPIDEQTGLEFKSTESGKMHACGHDIHTTTLLGTALTLNKFKENLNGNVRLIFQSGEEIFYGARKVIESGILNEPKVNKILMFHTWPDLPAGTIGLKKNEMMASSTSFNFKIKGKGAHAAHPQKGNDPVVIGANLVSNLQSIISRRVGAQESAVVTIGKLEAGKVSNVIPDAAYGEGTIRTLNSDLDQFIQERITDLFEYGAKSFGAVGEVNFEQATYPVVNDPDIIDTIEKSAENSIGLENIHWLKQASMGSEDFSLYLQDIPGALVRLGTNNDDERSKRALHSNDIHFDEKAIPTGVKVMSNVIVDLLNDK